jgi:hypothetical protein
MKNHIVTNWIVMTASPSGLVQKSESELGSVEKVFSKDTHPAVKMQL